MQYKELLLEELYILTKHCNYDYEALENMAVYKRRFFLNKYREEIELQKQEQQKIESKMKSQTKR